MIEEETNVNLLLQKVKYSKNSLTSSFCSQKVSSMVIRFPGKLKYRAEYKEGLTVEKGGIPIREKGLNCKHFVWRTAEPPAGHLLAPPSPTRKEEGVGKWEVQVVL